MNKMPCCRRETARCTFFCSGAAAVRGENVFQQKRFMKIRLMLSRVEMCFLTHIGSNVKLFFGL